MKSLISKSADAASCGPLALPLISVLVPVFNDERHLAAALESIQRQTLADFEVIISDDASTDRSAEEALRFAAEDSRFRVIRQTVNLGMTRNWNAALAMARGRFICKLDSDDAFGPDALRSLFMALDSSADAVVAFCRTLQCDADLSPVASYLGDSAFIRARIDPLSAHLRPGHGWYRLAFDDVQLWHSNALMFTADGLRQLGGWDECYGCASDTDLILRALEMNWSVAHVPYAGVRYRIREGSVSDTYRRGKLLAIEGAIVHLSSLQRYRHRAGRLDARLRFNWHRIWKNYCALAPNFTAITASLRPDACARLKAAASALEAPPLLVRAGGWVAHARSALSRWVRRGSRSGWQ